MKITIEHDRKVESLSKESKLIVEFTNVPESLGDSVEHILRSCSNVGRDERTDIFAIPDGKVDHGGNPIYGLDYWG